MGLTKTSVFDSNPLNFFFSFCCAVNPSPSLAGPTIYAVKHAVVMGISSNLGLKAGRLLAVCTLAILFSTSHAACTAEEQAIIDAEVDPRVQERREHRRQERRSARIQARVQARIEARNADSVDDAEEEQNDPAATPAPTAPPDVKVDLVPCILASQTVVSIRSII